MSLSVGPALRWRPVKGVLRLWPNVSWDWLQLTLRPSEDNVVYVIDGWIVPLSLHISIYAQYVTCECDTRCLLSISFDFY